ncbi:phage tail tape measure protein [Vibrio parahaemolyticus]|uniref:phage tail tape measure protein n=1 Tax=Vibrio parahaemolyticus TaxID=670 RepID=UPI0004DF6F93|nr:phage tail tape measure protein [Vibrio parahaemolyticus]
MSISKKGSGYALELVVGIQDEFSNQSKAITESTKKLEREVKDLQKTTSDISQYEKSKNALEQLEKQQLNTKDAVEKQKAALKKLKKESGETDEYKRQQKALQLLQKEERETTAQTREHERVIRRLKSSLSDAGLDVNHLADDESKLKAKIDKTNQSIKEQSQQMNKLGTAQDKIKSFGEKMSLVAGGAAVAGTLLYRGNDMLKNELLFSARTGTSLSDVQSAEQRNFRSELVRKYGATSGDIFTAQAIATQQGLGSQESMNLAASAIEMQEVFGDIDPQESIRAIANAAKGFNVSTTEAANTIFAIRQASGDANGDLMDTFAEYAPLLGDKMSLKQYAASLTAGRKAGVWNYDKIGDSFKEAFQARFSDAGEFEKLVGGGTTVGAIEGIKDPELRKLIRGQAFKVRNTMATGGDVGSAYAEFMQSLLPAMQLDPGAIKPIMEMAGGVIYSEDVGTEGVKAIADAMANPDKYLKDASLSDAASGVQTSAEKGINAGKAIQMGIDSSTGKLIESQDTLATAINDLAGYISRGMGHSNALGFAGGVLEGGAAILGGGALLRFGGKHIKKMLGMVDVAKSASKSGWKSNDVAKTVIDQKARNAANAAKTSPVDVAADVATQAQSVPKTAAKATPNASAVTPSTDVAKSPKSTTKATPENKTSSVAKAVSEANVIPSSVDVATDVAQQGKRISKATSKGASFLKKAGRLGKRIPLIGTAINTALIGTDIATGDDRGLWRDVGGIIGGLGGGVAGSLIGPAGSVAGGIGGSYAGEQVGDWLYSMFHDAPDVKQVEAMVPMSSPQSATQVPAAQVEFVYSPQINLQPIGSSDEQIAALSTTLVDALRNATPELIQQLKDTLEDTMMQSSYLKN